MSINPGAKEIWRWVNGYEGLYMVSDHGRVMSAPKPNHYGHIMKPKKTRAGYMAICLSKNNEKKHRLIHRLVAEAFIENPEGKAEVNHKNGNRADNSVENLEWATRSENVRHAYRVLGKKPNKPWLGKPQLHRRIFNNEQVREIRASSLGSRKLAEAYGVSHTTIKNIRNGKIYKEVI